MKNLFDIPKGNLKDELFEKLAEGEAVRIERIVSDGQSSPEGFWFDQQDDEWVCLLQGQAALQIEGEAAPRLLRAGDFILLKAHCRHRVERTSRPCIWLAVFGRF